MLDVGKVKKANKGSPDNTVSISRIPCLTQTFLKENSTDFLI